MQARRGGRRAYRLTLIGLLVAAAAVVGLASLRGEARTGVAQRALSALCAARAADASGGPSYDVYQAALGPLAELASRLERVDAAQASALGESLSWLATALDGHAWDVPLSTYADEVLARAKAAARTLGEPEPDVC